MNKPFREGFVEDEPVEIEATAIDHSDLEPPPPPPEEWPIVMSLRKAIKGPQGVVSQLSFREPTAGDLLLAGGNPIGVQMTELNAAGDAIYNWTCDDAKMIRLMASLSGILEPFLKRLSPKDYESAKFKLRPFLLPG
jgi:hypothetical protein